MRKTPIDRGKISLWKDTKIGKRCEENAIELVENAVPNLLKHFNHIILRVCDELCG